MPKPRTCYVPKVPKLSFVQVDHAKLKRGCGVDAPPDEILIVVGHIAPMNATSNEEEVRLQTLTGELVGMANISAVTITPERSSNH